MDTVLHLSETLFMSKVYSLLPYPLFEMFSMKDSLQRQAMSLWIMATVGGLFLYFFFSISAFYTYFDRNLMNHPKIVKNQIKREITLSMYQIPVGAALMIPFWLAEVNGYSKVYYPISDHGLPFFVFSFFAFLVFSDFWIYWIHRYFLTLFQIHTKIRMFVLQEQSITLVFILGCTNHIMSGRYLRHSRHLHSIL